uniref:Uncharacterized protein n=1 Tax=Anguilla anguilla TaxID=7936 RepID=A0A0E9WNI0_ANGAN
MILKVFYFFTCIAHHKVLRIDSFFKEQNVGKTPISNSFFNLNLSKLLLAPEFGQKMPLVP